MADGILRPRPQPILRYLPLAAGKWLIDNPRPTIALAALAGVCAEFHHWDSLQALLGYWETVLWGYMASFVVVPVVGAGAVGVVYLRKKAQ